VDGKEVELSVDSMDMYLADQPNKPQDFALWGEEATIVGQLPSGVKIDEDENFQVLVGKTIPIKARIGTRRDGEKSYVMVNGQEIKVTGGTLIVDKIEDEYVLHGRITLKVQTTTGEKTWSGTFKAAAAAS
jgi:hypothetical protein